MNSLTSLFWALLLFLIDGVKSLAESFAPYKEKDFTSEHEKVSIIIPLFNKEDFIREVLSRIADCFPEENIYIVDDDSTDSSLRIAGETVPRANLITLEKNHGKVRAVEKALAKIKTEFTLLLDADTLIPKDFQCPTSMLEDDVTAIALNVTPANPIKNFLTKLQSYEYMKSMVIGKKFQDRSNSVHCISGAAGLFRTERFIELSKQHTKVFTAEDLERTLIELANEGQVAFVDQEVHTYIPETFSEMTKQRCVGWWPGLWRTLPLFGRLFWSNWKKGPWQLKGEIVYIFFSLLTDPLKLISLVALIIAGSWQILIALYVIYTLLELAIYLRLGKGQTKEKTTFMVVPTYFFYNLLQIVYRVVGFVVLIWMLIRKKAVLAYSIAFFFIGGAASELYAQKKSDLRISAGYEYIKDSSGRTIDNINASIVYKEVYASVKTAKQAPRYLLLGGYIPLGKNSFLHPSLLLKKGGQTGRLTASFPPIGPFVGKLGVDYHRSEVIDNFFSYRAGLDYYWGNYNYTMLTIIKDQGREYATTAILRNYVRFSKNFSVTLGAAVNDDEDVGIFGRTDIWKLYFQYSSYQNFDFANFDRESFEVGIKLNF